ncbi:hypothetical protein ACFY0R_39685 [Streptomyces sp. NPDC001633]|uniref:hypothetical protein n=1 Tax=Streptomyces sp. NPDC001633 TaxID=3364595 RepID=UPI0036CA5DB1
MPKRTDYRAAADRSSAPPRPRGKAAMRTTPVRTTLDLAPELHMDLKRWCNAAAVELHQPDVPLVAVLRQLVHLLAVEVPDDEEHEEFRTLLAERVRERLEQAR